MSTLKQNRVLVTVVAILAVTLFAGALHGHLSQRWGPPVDVLELAHKLDDLPSEIGDWRLQSDDELEPEVQLMLQCAGHVKRSYVNLKTGDLVTVAVLLGPFGPIAVHTPEICYSSRDFEIAKPRERFELFASSTKHEFWSSTFSSRNGIAGRLSVWYAWNSGDGWKAATYPRFAFSGKPYLYKIQVASVTYDDLGPKTSDSCRSFLEALLPVLQERLPQDQ